MPRPVREESFVRRRSALGFAVLATLAGALTGCGSNEARSTHAVTQPRAVGEQLTWPAKTDSVVARVGRGSISGAAFNRAVQAQLSSAAPSERLDPPRFDSCVAQLRAEATSSGESQPGRSHLREECDARYQALLRQVLDRLLANQWLIAEARALGVGVGDRQAKASLDSYRRESFSNEAEFREFRAGRTTGDMITETKAKLSSAAIRRITERYVRPTERQVANYYRSHPFQYLLAAERDLQIVRALSKASAVRARAEIESGQSFASEETKLRSYHVLYSEGGLVVGLKLHVYGEPGLNQAIFTARPGALVGPLNTHYGYFVFRVRKVRLERKRPLADVRASIEHQLAARLQRQALVRFARQWRARWTARTSCIRGYVVPNCRGFRGSSQIAAADVSMLA
jgi:hypothetical protein